MNRFAKSIHFENMFRQLSAKPEYQDVKSRLDSIDLFVEARSLPRSDPRKHELVKRLKEDELYCSLRSQAMKMLLDEVREYSAAKSMLEDMAREGGSSISCPKCETVLPYNSLASKGESYFCSLCEDYFRQDTSKLVKN